MSPTFLWVSKFDVKLGGCSKLEQVGDFFIFGSKSSPFYFTSRWEQRYRIFLFPRKSSVLRIFEEYRMNEWKSFFFFLSRFVFFFFPGKDYTSLTNSNFRAWKKKNSPEKKNSTLLTHSIFPKKVQILIFSGEIKKYGTFVYGLERTQISKSDADQVRILNFFEYFPDWSGS